MKLKLNKTRQECFYKLKFSSNLVSIYLFFELIFCDQGANMRLNLNRKLIPIFQEHILPQTNTSGRSGYNDSACRKSRTLRQEAHKLGNSEDEITAFQISHFSFHNALVNLT